MKNRVKGRGNFIFSNTRIAVFFPFSTNGRKWKTGEWRREAKEEGENGDGKQRRREAGRKGGMEDGGKLAGRKLISK